MLAPGERWHYSNLAFILLGEVVAELSGMPYEDYVEQRILQPLGLTRTSFSPEEPTALAYSVEPYSDVLQREPMLVERTGGIAAAGQLWSTVGDLCRWASFLADPGSRRARHRSRSTLMTSVQTMADPYRWSLAWGVGLALARSGRPDLLRARRRHARLPGERARRPRATSSARRCSSTARRSRRRSSRSRSSTRCASASRRSRRRGARARRRRRSSRARSAAGGPRARSSSSAGTTAGSRRAWPERPSGSRGLASSLSTATASAPSSGASAASCSALVRDARRERHAHVLGDVPVQPRAGGHRHAAVPLLVLQRFEHVEPRGAPRREDRREDADDDRRDREDDDLQPRQREDDELARQRVRSSAPRTIPRAMPSAPPISAVITLS